MSTTMPLVSCLCVTEGRAAFMPWLLWGYDRQRYPNRELVIVDSSPKPFEAPAREDVRVLAMPPGSGVARKRNTALQAAAGEVIVWMDDDDWQHPDRLACLVEALDCGAAYAGARRAWFVHLFARMCRPHAGLQGQMVFNSAAFRKAAALATPFPEHVKKASDTPWMTALAARFPAGAVWLDRQDLFFWLCHGENISNPSTRRSFSEPLDRLRIIAGNAAWGDTEEALDALAARVLAQADAAARDTATQVQAPRFALRGSAPRLSAAPAKITGARPSDCRPAPAVQPPAAGLIPAGGAECIRLPVSLVVKAVPEDAPYLETMVRHIQNQSRCLFIDRLVVIDRGVAGETQANRRLDQAAERLLAGGSIDRVMDAGEHPGELGAATETYFPGSMGVPGYAGDGSPIASTLLGIEASASDWVLQTDADLFFHTQIESWVQRALVCLQTDAQIWMMTAHPGPPAGPPGHSLVGGNARTGVWDAGLRIWRFPHATTRYFLCDRRRLRGALRPMRLPNGFAALEACISLALRRQAAWRGALGEPYHWHLHALYHGDPFPGWAPALARLIEAGRFPQLQRGEFDLRLDLNRSRQAWAELVAAGA